MGSGRRSNKELRCQTCSLQRGSTMIPVIIDTGSAALGGLLNTGSAAFHGILNTLWTGSFGG
ncbi:hypothetical protein GCM10027089_36610 [Nocardia thraciensis]